MFVQRKLFFKVFQKHCVKWYFQEGIFTSKDLNKLNPNYFLSGLLLWNVCANKDVVMSWGSNLLFLGCVCVKRMTKVFLYSLSNTSSSVISGRES